MSTSNPRDETTTEEPHQITFTPEPSSKYPVEYLMGARTLAHFILVLKEYPPANKLAYEDFMRFTFLPMLMCLEEDIPKNLCALDRTRVVKERVPLLEKLAELLPLYIDTNVDVLRGFIAKQIEAFKAATDDTEHNNFFNELPTEKPKLRVPIIPRQPRNRSTPKVDVTDKPPEKTKIDIATLKAALESSIVLDTFLNRIKDSYQDFYPNSTMAVIQIESMQILSRAVYEFIYEQYARIDWNNWASTLKTLYIHVELQKQIVDYLKLTQTYVSNIDNEQLKYSAELPKEKSEMLTEFSRVLHEWEESLNITKNNISHMKNLLAENKERLQEKNQWEKETKELSELSKEARKIPTTQETLETTHQTLKKIHADLNSTNSPIAHSVPICAPT